MAAHSKQQYSGFPLFHILTNTSFHALGHLHVFLGNHLFFAHFFFFAHFLIKLFASLLFLFLLCYWVVGVLYIFLILSDMWFASVFFHSIGCILLLMVSFAVRKLFKILYTGNCKTLMKEIEEDTSKWKGISRLWIGRINIAKMFILFKAI